MREQRQKHRIDRVLLLLLFAVFAATILLVLVSGADIVQRMTVRDQSSFEQRTAVQYLTARVRQADREENMTVENFGGCDAIVFYEYVDGIPYETKVYCWDGYLRELFQEAGMEAEPSWGEAVLPACGLEISLDGQVLRMEVQLPDGGQDVVILQLRSGEGAAT